MGFNLIFVPAMTKKARITILFSLLSFVSAAQGIFSKQLPQRKYPESVVDSVYGIIMYEKLVAALGGDSIRKNGVYACQGWFEDAYESGQILHKGYYVAGQLQSYKNFYPNGQVERDFASIDNMFGEGKLYYSSGKMKSHIKYAEGIPKQWTDYYEDGKVQYEEKMNKSMDYFEYQKYYYPSGALQKVILLSDKKKLEFSYTEYFENGTVKVEGHRIFTKESNTYFDHGEWKYFDQSGAKTKTEKFDRGVKL